MKADWEKAVTLYEMAYQAGSGSAWSAMVAALAVAGRDNGRALWYAAQRPAAQRPSSLPPYCFPKADPLKDPDGFNAGLERMTPEAYNACVYMVGVTSEVEGHAQFPSVATRFAVQGDLTMTFTPSAGTITWTFQQTADSIITGEQYGKESTIDNSLLTYVTAKSKYALTRYTRPPGIDPTLVLRVKYVFTLDD
jgi:hypothetical protein